VKVRIAEKEFDNVRGEPALKMAERVAAAIAAKYWSDPVVRYMSHPLALRLVAPRIPSRTSRELVDEIILSKRAARARSGRRLARWLG
jgi:hypothetical protein